MLAPHIDPVALHIGPYEPLTIIIGAVFITLIALYLLREEIKGRHKSLLSGLFIENGIAALIYLTVLGFAGWKLTSISIDIHWYGLMYVLAFMTTWKLVQLQLKEMKLWNSTIKPELYENLFTWLILGVILGGRLGYVLFYNPAYYLAHPVEVFYVWNGGMSFHGGFLGPVITGWWFCKRHKLPFLLLLDRFAIVAPLGLAFGRMGNFINGELWGRVADVPWAMIFPGAGPDPRHPSQLYEMALEGLLLFTVLWLTRKKAWADGTRISIFLLGYALARIFCENFREPDAHIGFLFSGVTMGMLLSSAMLVAGIAGIIWVNKRK